MPLGKLTLLFKWFAYHVDKKNINRLFLKLLTTLKFFHADYCCNCDSKGDIFYPPEKKSHPIDILPPYSRRQSY